LWYKQFVSIHIYICTITQSQRGELSGSDGSTQGETSSYTERTLYNQGGQFSNSNVGSGREGVEGRRHRHLRRILRGRVGGNLLIPSGTTSYKSLKKRMIRKIEIVGWGGRREFAENWEKNLIGEIGETPFLQSANASIPSV